MTTQTRACYIEHITRSDTERAKKTLRAYIVNIKNISRKAAAGSEEAFAELMNKRASELSMNDTHFLNSTGLPQEGHVTSAHDIAVMTRELSKHKQI